jgi:hypothetical protein
MINLSGEIPKVRTWLRRLNLDESDRPLTTSERSCGYPMGLLAARPRTDAAKRFKTVKNATAVMWVNLESD